MQTDKTEYVSAEFSFIQKLRSDKARRHRKRPISFSTENSDSFKKNMGSQPSRDQKVSKTQAAESSDKRKKISWP